jgi:hypothetical protein
MRFAIEMLVWMGSVNKAANVGLKVWEKLLGVWKMRLLRR